MSLTVRDAPDYTGLADVRIIAQIEALEVTGSITVSSGNVEITGPLTAEGNIPIAIQESIELDVNITNSVVNIQGTVVVSSGSVEISGPLSAGGNVNVAVQESVQIDVNVTNSTLTITGSVTVSSGSVEISGPLTTEGNVSVAINQSIELDVNVTNSVINIQGSVDANITNATLTIEGNVNVTNSILNVNITNEVLQSKLAKPALAFNGENAYVEAPNFITQKPFTLMIRLKLDAIQVNELLDSRDDLYPRGGKGLRITDENGNGKYLVGIGDGTTHVYSSESIDLSDLQEHTVIITCSSTEMKIYVDGNLVGTLNVSSIADSPLNAATYLNIGRNFQGANYFPGKIYYFMWWNEEITNIDALMNNPQSPPTSNLVCWLNFDEGSGDVAYDKSGNGNHGTIYNCVWVSEQGQVAPLLAVNIAAKQVTLDINITAQDVDVKIINPSGIPIYTGGSLISSVKATGNAAYGVNPGSEITLLSATGRGVLRQVAVWVRPDQSITPDEYGIRIYVDGSTTPNIELTLEDMDRMNGNAVYPYGGMAAGEAIRAPVLSKAGGMVTAYKDPNSGAIYFGAVFQEEIEFTSSIDVKFFASSYAVHAWVEYVVSYGTYP